MEEFMERISRNRHGQARRAAYEAVRDQRWGLDNIVRANGIDWTQPRSLYISGPCGMKAGRHRRRRERSRKMADIAPAFEAVARRREAKAKARRGRLAIRSTARDNYFMAAVYWARRNAPTTRTTSLNVGCHLKKRENYTKYARWPDHKIEAAWIPFKGHCAAGLVSSAPNYRAAKSRWCHVPGMDSYKEISTALYGDRFLNRGFATLNIGTARPVRVADARHLFLVDNWVATGKAVCDWLAKRPEVDMSK